MNSKVSKTSRNSKASPHVHIERGAKDRILPKQFVRVLTRRYFPVLSLTYVSAVIGIAYKKGNMAHYLLEDQFAYTMAMLPALWISVPAILWVILKGSHLFHHVAGLWYVITAILMSLMLGMSYILLPEFDYHGARSYLVATIPMMIVLYFTFVRSALPAGLAHSLSAVGLTALIYGASIRLWM